MKSVLFSTIKRILETGILLCLVTIVSIFVFGGFKTILGIKVSATTPLNPITFLFLLVIIRIVIVLKKKDAALFMGSILFCLLSIEIFLRLWNPLIVKPELQQIHQTSSNYGWELIPNAVGVGTLGEQISINSHGFRGPEFSMSKPEGARRIMIIGDSFTFGMGVNSEDTYAKQLESLLKGQGKNFEVLNCGVIGYRMWQNYEVLKHKAPQLKPDLIILGVFLNDIWQATPPYSEDPTWKPVNPFEKKRHEGLANYSYLYKCAVNLNRLYKTKYPYRKHEYIEGIEKRKKSIGPSHHWHKIMYGTLDRKKYVDFSKTLNKFVAAAEAIGSNVLVLMIPDGAQMHDHQRQHVNRFVKSECEKINIPFVDATHAFECETDTNSLYLFPADAHISKKGYGIIAKILAKEIPPLLYRQ